MTSPFFDTCQELFSTRNLYEILSISDTATGKEIKRAYYKLSLKVHPDRANDHEKESATRKFQILSKIYSILSDKGQRELYNETGEVDDELDIDQDKDWSDYWRLLFPKITKKKIQEFEQEYRGSAEELDDLKSLYERFEGDMDAILEHMISFQAEDEARFYAAIQEAIDQGELRLLAAWKKSNTKAKKRSRARKAAAEEAEAAEMAAEQGLGDAAGDDALVALLKKRQASRESEVNCFLANLEAKYASKKPKKGGSKAKKGGKN